MARIALLLPLAVALKMKETCHKWSCGQGWVAKMSEGLTGSSNEECCDRTCALWMCGPGFIPNEAYSNNVAQNNQLCCDKVCGPNFACSDGWSPLKSKEAQPGVSNEECCGRSCSLYECPENHVSNPAKTSVIANDTTSCCLPLCKSYQCKEGWNPDLSRAELPGQSEVECCTQECALFDHLCPKHYGVKPSKRCEQGNSPEMCCDSRCSAFRCADGWATNESAQQHFGNSSEECCAATCAKFDCDMADGWLPLPRTKALSLVSSEPESCCAPACSRYNCSEGYVANPEAAALGKTGDEACCLKTCVGFSCGKDLVLRANASELVGQSQEVCCEPQSCGPIRTKMSFAPEGCHSVSRKDCNSHYYKFSAKNKTNVVQCSFNKTLQLCRNQGLETIGCDFD